MTSVNSPASLLARNNFYRTLSSSPEPIKPPFDCRNESVMHKPKQVTLWVTMTTPPGLMGTKEIQVDILLGSPPSLHFSSNKPANPADRRVK